MEARQPARLRVLTSSQQGSDAADTPADAPAGTTSAASALSDYAELHCLTNFSFQRSASSPEELVAQAYHLGYRALAITDECSVAGIVRAHVALRDHPETIANWERLHPDQPPLKRNPDFPRCSAANSGSSASSSWPSRTTSKAGAICANSSPRRAPPKRPRVPTA